MVIVVAAILEQETYVPEHDSNLAQIHDFLAAHETRHGRSIPSRYYLAGSDLGDRVELPTEIYAVLRQVVEAMHANLAVTVVPQGLRMTTQQAADLLGISRPTFVKLLTRENIPFEQNDSHRRILLRDVLAYRERRRAQQYEALAALAGAPHDDDEDEDAVMARLAQARKDVAHRRKSQ